MCSISGKWRFVIEIGAASISLAHTGRMPQRIAASGNTPIPSKRLPKVIVLFPFFPPLMSAEDALRNRPCLKEHEAQKDGIAHSAPYGADGIAACCDTLDQYGINRNAHKDQ